MAFEDEEDSDGNNSEKGFHSPNNSSSEEGERRRKSLEFCKEDLNNPKFEKGMLFGRKGDLKTALKNYLVMGNYAIKFVKNDKRRLIAKCRNCTWMLHASFMQLEQTLQIKSFNDKHTCLQTPTNHMSIREIKLKNLRKAVKRDLGYNVSHSQCSRAKKKAMEIIEGTYKEQYSR
ncbi:PREDICTED: Transposase MuDR plant [Prunus dulcis]|uniref:PREDICTED: Transposase MuDR plant n=1 Tax=Prunus dulcis TaxID=3755 RepID=A0A5E4FKP6_PRUDU|nr:PREDICTED: Transposase MuDR plant [Prunus dulcis]